MLVNSENIVNYIPQRAPFIMVDSLLSYSSESTRSCFLIKSDNILVDKDQFSEAGLIENMAQTAALSKGYEFSLLNKSTPLGFLGAVKKLLIHRLPKVGEKIETTIFLKHVIMKANIVEAQVLCEKELLASCELSIFIDPKTS